MAFHETLLPNPLARGMTGGPMGRTQIVGLTSGSEERNSPWSQFRHVYDVAPGVKCQDDLAQLKAFFLARHGRLHAFRVRDHADFKSCLPSQAPSATDQLLGVAPGGGQAEWQLIKVYESGLQSYTRTIYKPVTDTVLIAVDGTPLASDAFEVDTTTGIVTLDTPATSGQSVTAGFLFDVPVRFDLEQLPTELLSKTAQFGAIRSIPLIEVRP